MIKRVIIFVLAVFVVIAVTFAILAFFQTLWHVKFDTAIAVFVHFVLSALGIAVVTQEFESLCKELKI